MNCGRKAAKKIKPYEYDRNLRGYQALDAPCYQVPGNKTLRQVLKKYRLPLTGDLFDRAYAYIRENY